VDSVPEGLCAPEQSVVNNWIVFPPVIVAISFSNRKRRKERMVFAHQGKGMAFEWSRIAHSKIFHFRPSNLLLARLIPAIIILN
jgi:hypothetical protein